MSFPRPLAAIGLLAILAALAAAALGGEGLFWDLQVYQDAADMVAAGGNPYVEMTGLRFVYPPLLLAAFAAAGSALTAALAALYLGATALLATRAMRPLALGAAVSAAAFFALPQAWAMGFATGNVSLFLHILIAWTMLRGARFGAGPFLALVVLASMFKPYYLAYLLVLPLLEGARARVLLLGGAAVGAVAAVAAAQMALAPEMFADFLDSLSAQAVGEASQGGGPGGGPGGGAGGGVDMGKGFYALAAKALGPEGGAAAHVLIAGALCLGGGWAAARTARGMAPEARLRFLVLTAIVLANAANPRLKVYDWAMLQAAATAAILMLLSLRFPGAARLGPAGRLLSPSGLTACGLALAALAAAGAAMGAEAPAALGRVLSVHLPTALLFGLIALDLGRSGWRRRG